MAEVALIAGKQITITGKSADYLGARKMAKEMGGRLISHATHDAALVGPNASDQIHRRYGCWNDDILAHPEKGGKFQKGKDIIDSQTGWILPASDVSRLAPEAFGVNEAYLYIKPTDFITDKKRIIVVPETIKVVLNAVQNSGDAGKVDEATRLPLKVEKEVWDTLTDEQKRWLYRIDGVGFRSLVRGFDGIGGYGNRRDVGADCRPSGSFGVLVEGATAQAPQADANGAKIIVPAGATDLKTLEADARQALGELAAAAGSAFAAQVVKVQNFIDALRNQ